MNQESDQTKMEMQIFMHKNSRTCFSKFKKLALCLQTKGQYKFCTSERKDYDECLVGGLANSEFPALRTVANDYKSMDNSKAYNDYDDASESGKIPPVVKNCIGYSAIIDYLDQYQWFAQPETQRKGIKYFRKLYVCSLTAENKQAKLAKWVKCFDAEYKENKFYSEGEFFEKFEKCGKELA
jgi:hypothetical protein